VSFWLSFHQALLGHTGAQWLDGPFDLSCKERTRQHSVDEPRLSCNQQVPRCHSAPRGQPAPVVQDSGLVFTWLDGRPIHPERFSRWFEQHARAAGLPKIRLHDVRHSYATAALAAGVPAKVISERLGHANIAITMDTYSHVLPGLDAEAADTVARLILGDGD
jgi:integrase